MKYFTAIKGSFVALVIFAIAAFLIPGQGESSQVELILTISSFLFAILVGFYISRSNSRYNEIRELVSQEDANFLSLYKVSALYGEEFKNKIADCIDRYYMGCYDLSGLDYYKSTAPYFLAIYDLLYENKKYRDETAMGNILEHLSDIERTRNQTAVLESERMSIGQWSVLSILSGVVIFCIFYLQVPFLYSLVITILLSTVIVLILLILRDLQNLRLSGKLSVEESGQENLEFMGKLRYYNAKMVEDGISTVPSAVKEYRAGFHQPGEPLNIKIIQNKNYDPK